MEKNEHEFCFSLWNESVFKAEGFVWNMVSKCSVCFPVGLVILCQRRNYLNRNSNLKDI
jgi:hypothetical protein